MLSVPVIAKVDLLVIGGTFKSIEIAIKAKKYNLNVLVITPNSYLGEEFCSTLNLWHKRCTLYNSIFANSDNHAQRPMAIKIALEDTLVGNEIKFYFQMTPVSILDDSNKKHTAVLVGNKSGMQIIKAKMVVDASERSLIARQSAMPFKKFKAGKHCVSLIQLFPEGVNAKGELLKNHFNIRGMNFNVWKQTRELYLGGTTPADINNFEIRMRETVFDPAAALSADRCLYNIDDGAIGLDPQGYVYIPEQFSDGILVELKNKPHNGLPITSTLSNRKNEKDNIYTIKSSRYSSKDHCVVDIGGLPNLGSYEVTVVGGGTAGAAAGISSGRKKSKTLVIEHLPHLGGVGTEGRIGVYWFGNRTGFTKEVDDSIAEIGGSDYTHIHRGAWNVQWKQHFWQYECLASRTDIFYETLVIAAKVDSGKVNELLVSGSKGIGWIKTQVLIDATGCADIAAIAGTPTIVSDAEEPAYQGVGLAPRIPGTNYENSDYSFCDDGDVIDRTRFFFMGRKCFKHEFDLSLLIDSRERRRIVGDITIDPTDICLNRKYSDTINIAKSNFDTHGFTVHPLFMLQPPNHEEQTACVPYRAMLPKGLENMLVTGLGISAHRDAMPVIRMQADVQNQGYAAGIAATMALDVNCQCRKISISDLQQELVECNILPSSELECTDQNITELTDTKDDIAAVFANPAAKIPVVKKRFMSDPNVNDALLLAFLGENVGHDVISNHISDAQWDAGWEYTGMGQFGASISRLDCCIIALSKICIPEDQNFILPLLKELKPESEFSHIRACALFICAMPDLIYKPVIEKFLRMPHMTGHAVNDLFTNKNVYTQNSKDTAERNNQLKEFYMAKALSRCDHKNKIARSILSSYANSMQGLFAQHALYELAKESVACGIMDAAII